MCSPSQTLDRIRRSSTGSYTPVMRWLIYADQALDRIRRSSDGPITPVADIALGKKNWLFTGSERAGRRAAAVQSLLATAKINGIEPYGWLKDTLEKLPSWPYSRIDELLPIRTSKA